MSEKNFELQNKQVNEAVDPVVDKDNIVDEIMKSIIEREDYSALENMDVRLHQEIASKLMESGQGGVVAENLDKFQGLDHRETAIKLIALGQSLYVLYNLDKFKGLDQKEIALKIIESVNIRLLLKHIDKFQGLDQEIALKIIEEGHFLDLAENLNKFKGLDQEIALKLIKAGNFRDVVERLSSFQGLGQEIALIFIEEGMGWCVAKYAHKFQDLDQEIALKLIEIERGWTVACDMDKKFHGLDHQKIATKLIESGQGEYVADNLDNFHGLDHQKIASELIELGKGQFVARNLDKFQGLDHKEIASKLIKSGQGEYVVDNLDKFQGLDHKEIASKLIKSGQGEYVVGNLGKFHDLDEEIALKLLIKAEYSRLVAENLVSFQSFDQKSIVKFIEEGLGSFVAQYLDNFHGLDHQEIARKIIEAGQGEYVADNLDNFHGLDHQKIASELIGLGQGQLVARNLDKFQGLDKQIVIKLIEAGQGEYVADNIDKFQGLDHQEIASKLIETRQGSSVAEYLDKFQGLDHQEIASKLIESGKGGSVAYNLDKFHGLDHQEIASKLFEAGGGYLVVDNLDKFQGLDHQEIASKLFKAGEGQSVVHNLDKLQGLDHQEVALKLFESGQGYSVANNLDKLQGLNQEIAFKLIEVGFFREVLDHLENSFTDSLENKYFLKAYKSDLGLPSKNIYNKYLELKRQGDEIQLFGYVGKTKDKIDGLVSSKKEEKIPEKKEDNNILRRYIEKIKAKVNNLISSKKQAESIDKQEDYQELVELVYPNHADSWTNFDSNETCQDRSSDIERFKIRDIYEIDLSAGVEMELREGEEKNAKAIQYLEQPISSIQNRFAAVGFDKAKMLGILDSDLDEKIDNIANKEIFKTREEKIYGLLLESLVGRFDAQEVKEVLVGYQFAEFEDIKTYLEGTRDRSEQAKNPDYAYLLELREFFADHIKEVERKIATEAQANLNIVKLLPGYYKEKTILENNATRQEEINRLRVDKLGLEGNLLERIMKELSRKIDKKGNPFELGTVDDNDEFVVGKKGQAIAGMIMAEQNRVAKAVEKLTGQDLDPRTIHLGELNLAEYLQTTGDIKEGHYDEELFSRYLVQVFQSVFEKELGIIDREIARYQPKDEQQRDKQRRKLECFITKNHTSAHARGVGGVCVSGDNPANGEECMWNLENYFQMVLRDKETRICQGLVLLHYYKDNGKKIITTSFNPSSTYLYKVNETQLFDGLLEQLSKFAKDNDIDIIAVNKNAGIRTNRTGGEFERAMDQATRKNHKEFRLSQDEVFSFVPEYHQRDLDIIWERE